MLEGASEPTNVDTPDYEVARIKLTEEDLWGFGQLLPVFLLVGPLYFLGSLLVREARATSISQGENTAVPQGTDHDTPLNLQNAPAPEMEVFDSNTQPQDSRLPSSVDHLPAQETVPQLPSLERGYYLTAAWMPPSTVSLCLNVLALAALFFFFVISEMEDTLLDYWGGSYSIAVNFFFPTFCGSFINILVGLAMDDKAGKAYSKKLKIVTLVVMSSLLQGVYWGIFIFHSELIYMAGFKELLGLAAKFWVCTYGLYVVVCIGYRLVSSLG